MRAPHEAGAARRQKLPAEQRVVGAELHEDRLLLFFLKTADELSAQNPSKTPEKPCKNAFREGNRGGETKRKTRQKKK